MSLNNLASQLATTNGPSQLGQMSMGAQRRTRGALEQVQSRALVAKLTEDARAWITNESLEHVGALSALEQHLLSVAPIGEARYRELVDSYTLGAAAAIRRWG